MMNLHTQVGAGEQQERRQSQADPGSAADLLHGEEPEEHGGGEQTDRGEERGPGPGAVGPEPGPDPQFGQHPPADHGESWLDWLDWTGLTGQREGLAARTGRTGRTGKGLPVCFPAGADVGAEL